MPFQSLEYATADKSEHLGQEKRTPLPNSKLSTHHQLNAVLLTSMSCRHSHKHQASKQHSAHQTQTASKDSSWWE